MNNKKHYQICLIDDTTGVQECIPLYALHSIHPYTKREEYVVNNIRNGNIQIEQNDRKTMTLKIFNPNNFEPIEVEFPEKEWYNIVKTMLIFNLERIYDDKK